MYQFALPLNIVYGFTVKSSQILKCCLLVSDTDHSTKVFLKFHTDQIALFVKKRSEKRSPESFIVGKITYFFLSLGHRNS